MKYYFHLSTYWNKGPSSTISMVYTPEGSKSNTIEVGQGSLKLIYTADEGKLTHFVNSRNLVCYIVEDIVCILSMWLLFPVICCIPVGFQDYDQVVKHVNYSLMIFKS